jgi:ATP-dependent protease ClpP protease subunit
MNKADLHNDYLLCSKRIIWLAEDVEEPVLERITTQIHFLRDEDAVAPIHLYIRSDGGSSQVGIALVNIIQQVGHVWGWLIGDSSSAAATIWAGCAKRLVFANGRMGIHPAMWYQSEVKFDAANASRWAHKLLKTDERQCEIYAAASSKNFTWWWERISLPGDMKWLDARELICIGMAEKAEGVK